MMMFDPLYMLMMLPALALAGIASVMVKVTYGKNSKVRS